MKNILIILGLCISTIINAQKYSYENDGKILENGVHVGKFEKTSETITILVNVDEDELINVEEASDDELKINYNIITFSDANNSIAYLNEQKKNVNILDVILRNKVFKAGVLQDEAVAQFCAKNNFESLLKKPKAKMQKEEAKAEKKEKKAEIDEDKEFEKDEKLVAKETKKENLKEARAEKKELIQEARQEKKNELADRKEVASQSKTKESIPEKIQVPSEEKTLILDKGIITYRKKVVGKYTELESLVKNKKGKLIIVYNKENKKVATVKYQNNSTTADILETATNTTNVMQLYTNTPSDILMEIIEKLIDSNLL